MMIYFTRSRLGGTYIYIYEYLLSFLDCVFFCKIKKNSHVLRQDEL